MKIAFLAQRHSVHTVRWVNALAQRGHEVHLVSYERHGEPLDKRVGLHALPIPVPSGYFLNAWFLKRLLADLKPDVLSTHFASGYGTLGRLSGFHPNVLSVWGSDVYDFPTKSPLHRALVRRNLRAADWVCSTSRVMAEHTQTLYPLQNLSVTPFGINLKHFLPRPRPGDPTTVTVGTVKTLAHKYGIDLLIRAFAEVRRTLLTAGSPLAEKLRLLIVGGGPDLAELQRLTEQLAIGQVTHFTGQVSHQQVPDHLHRLDIYLALSRLESESFGVAVLEASACALPVVVAHSGGLPEVVVDGQTGFIVAREDSSAAAQAVQTLVEDAELRRHMGQAGRAHVERHYDWQDSVERLEAVFQKVTGAGASQVS